MEKTLELYRSLLMRIDSGEIVHGTEFDSQESQLILDMQQTELVDGFVDATTQIGVRALSASPRLTEKGALFLGKVKPEDKWKKLKKVIIEEAVRSGISGLPVILPFVFYTY